MKKAAAFLFAFMALALLSGGLRVCAYAALRYVPPTEVNSEAVYLADGDGNVLYEKNSDQRMYPSELTQIMTAIVVAENIESVGGWNAEATFTTSMQNYLYENRGGTILTGLTAGEILTADQLFHAMVISSGYDAAMALAQLIAGSQDDFVLMMNEKAKDLGAVNTSFTNCHGLHDTANYTTAYDMYLIARYAMSLDKFAETVSMTTYRSGETNYHTNLTWNSDNGLLVKGNVHYYSAAQGIKTGYSQDTGRSVASFASQDGYSYYQIDMGAPFELDQDTYNLALVDAKNLFVWAFSEFEVKSVINYGDQVGEVPLELAWQKDHLQLMAGENYVALLPADIDVGSITYQYELPEYVNAPVNKGDHIGTLHFIASGEEIGAIPLLSAEDVKQSELLSGLDSFSQITRSFWFKFVVVMIFIIFLLYVALMVVRNYNHKKYGAIRKKRNL